MSKSILTESTKSKFKVLEHKPANVLKRIQGVLSDFKSNRNGRKYPRELWQNVLNSDYVKEMIESHGLVGELDHPETRLEISLQNVSHVINDMWIEGDQVLGTIDILPTPSGKIVSELLDYGTDIGISSRGAGTVLADDSVDPSDYQFVTFDFVARPSCEAARLNMIVEGVQTEIDNNSDDKVNNILENYKATLKEDNTTSSYIDIREIVTYAENYLSDKLNSSVGIVKKDDGQYMITMHNDDETIDKWLKLHNALELDEAVEEIDMDKEDAEFDKAIAEFCKALKAKYDGSAYREHGWYSDRVIYSKGKTGTFWYHASTGDCDASVNGKPVCKQGEYCKSIEELVAKVKRRLNRTMKESISLKENKNEIDKAMNFETYTDYSGNKPVKKQRHTNDYCTVAAAEFTVDRLPANWRELPEDELEDLVREEVNTYNYANVELEYEKEDFYGDEANAREVYQYILDNKKSKETRVNESDENKEDYFETQLSKLYDEILTLAKEAEQSQRRDLSKKLDNMLDILDMYNMNESVNEYQKRIMNNLVESLINK